MNETETYLMNVKSGLTKHIMSGCIVYLAASFGALLLSYYIYNTVSAGDVFVAVSPVKEGNAADVAVSSLGSMAPLAALLLLIFASSFTIANRGVMLVLCMWRGASAGCAAALCNRGVLLGFSATWGAGICLYFAANMIIVFLCSCSAIYSDAICRTHLANNRKYTRSLVREFIKCFLVISGGAFTANYLSVILL